MSAVSIVGATGAVGRTMLSILEERDFPAKSIKFLASARSAGLTIAYKGRDYTVRPVSPMPLCRVPFPV